MRPLLATVAAVALFAAGCLSSSPASPGAGTGAGPGTFPAFVPPAPDFDFSTVVDPDHQAHELPDLHTAGHGLDLVGFTPIQKILPTGVRGSITQIDVWGDYAVVSGMEGGLGFAIVDLKDRAHPKAISFYPSTADGWSARFSDDGQYVFYGCQTLGALGYPTTNVQGTCADPTALHLPGGEGNGVVAVDVADKAHPKFVDYLPLSGSHNIFVSSIHGEDYIFTEVTEIVHFDRATKKLAKVAEVSGVHDASVAQNPVTGDWLLSTGASGGLFSIYDINNPADPQPLCDACLPGVVGWHEQTFVPGLVDGRFLLILAGENFCGQLPASLPFLGCGKGPDNGLPDVVSVVNVTDPAHPALLGQWTPPIKPVAPWLSYAFSAHEMAATPTGQVAMGWYHGGVWVFDVSTQARQEAPVTLAAYQPHEPLSALPPAMFAQVPLPFIPFVWGAGWTSDGYLVVPDMHTGVYVLQPEWGLHPAKDSGQ